MVQTYDDILVSTLITASRAIILARDEALHSNWSGTSYPTSDLLIGQTCYRTDIEKLFLLRSTGPSVFVEVADLTETYLSQEDADARYLDEASNLSDVASASTSFNNIKQLATISATGVSELATSAETVTGTDAARVVTPAGLQAKVASTTKKGIVELATITEANAGTDSTRAITAAGLKTAVTGQQTVWVPAGSMTSANTAGAEAATTVYGTTYEISDPTMAFDKDVDEFCHFTIAMPKSWNAGTITWKYYWTSTATSGGVSIWLKGKSMANSGAIGGTAWGTNDEVIDVALSPTGDLMISPEGTMTVSGATQEELVFFEVMRDVSDSSDTMAADFLLHGIMIQYINDQMTDD